MFYKKKSLWLFLLPGLLGLMLFYVVPFLGGIYFSMTDGTILSIARNTTPLSEAPIPSGGPVVGVLELAGGRTGEIGLMPGDRIEHRIFKRD